MVKLEQMWNVIETVSFDGTQSQIKTEDQGAECHLVEGLAMVPPPPSPLSSRSSFLLVWF